MPRPDKYLTHVEPRLLEIEAWARDGTIDSDISKKLGVAYSTFKTYRHKYPALVAALKRGKDVVDIEVENTLYKRAMGYEYDEVTKERVLNPKTGKYDLCVTKIVRKQVVPDVTAQIFWLKNRRPDNWRDIKAQEITGKDGGPVQVEGFNITIVDGAEDET